ncbi:MAG TPA: DUF434 domain-containing protein [Candidatus Hydrogenedentes bacterium]|nr:DUF434 domain-containing protein [Candidatus Hydrogenedentota bacterium]HOL75732.1 DUF434 domain-containing protein [Candidatus Hydrogenedentota bacterium]HPO84275.1 DUF434 domain-containing protein [Candidatus Hydrogenedentota bacterium]
MSTHLSHRGKGPEDNRLFSSRWLPLLRKATTDLSYLLTRGYSEKAAEKLVGDRYQLHERQRNAVARAACSNQSLAYRRLKQLDPSCLKCAVLEIDGLNILITLETLLSGGVVIRCRDGCVRDLSSIHRTYRCVTETAKALELVKQSLEQLNITQSIWHFDKPVSNSGRLKRLIEEFGQTHGLSWQAVTETNPDDALADSEHIVVSSDGWILDRAARWLNLGELILGKMIRSKDVFLLDLSEDMLQNED